MNPENRLLILTVHLIIYGRISTFNRMKKTGIYFCLHCGLFLFLLLTGASCRKESSSPDHENTASNKLGFVFFYDKTIEINQAIIVYDSTRIRDSLDFAVPPADKYYEWTTSPDNGCGAVISSHLPMTDFIFHCAGNYFLSAKIYDDSTKHILVGHTDTLEIQVTSDTLYPTQIIQTNDVLKVTPGIASIRSADHVLDEVFIQMILSSTQLYEGYTPYIQFDYTTTTGPNLYSYQFSDSIRLNSYPFSFGNGTKDVVWASIDLHGLTYGVPAKLSIIWLGKLYEGTITLLNQYQWTMTWDNSGQVKMIF